MLFNDLLGGLDRLLCPTFNIIRLLQCLLNFLIDLVIMGEEKLRESFLFWRGHFRWRFINIWATLVTTIAIFKIGNIRWLGFNKADGLFNFLVSLWRIIVLQFFIMVKTHDIELRLEDYIKTSLLKIVLIPLDFTFDQWKRRFIVFLYLVKLFLFLLRADNFLINFPWLRLFLIWSWISTDASLALFQLLVCLG